MSVKSVFRFSITLLIFSAAILSGWSLWKHYMVSPWTRDGRIRADVVNVAPDVSGQIVDLPVRDNQLVRKGALLMAIDPAPYLIALRQAEAAVLERKAALDMQRARAVRRAGMDNLAVSRETREDASAQASAAAAQYQIAVAQRDAAQLHLARTKVVAPVDGYVTNLNVRRGDYASAGAAKIALIDSHSFWVYGYFEETKLPYLHVGDVARIQLISGAVLEGHLDSIARGIYDRDNPQSRELLADVNPTFNWVRLAQRVPVRIHIDAVPKDVLLAAGMTCTVALTPARQKGLAGQQ